jgi:hypothetical protein
MGMSQMMIDSWNCLIFAVAEGQEDASLALGGLSRAGRCHVKITLTLTPVQVPHV